jgi:hypothetical protein
VVHGAGRAIEKDLAAVGIPDEPKINRIVRGDLRLAILLVVAAFALLVLVNLPFLATYAVKGDDLPLLYHSSRSFSPSPVEWVTNGFDGYSVVVPEIQENGTNWIRPVQNAYVYVLSLLFPDPAARWLLLGSYLGHALVVGLVFLVAQRIFHLAVGPALLTAVLFFGTASIGGLLASIAFNGDMLATLFALCALLVAHSYLTKRAGMVKGAAIVGLLTLAVFTKEAALAAPVVVGIYVVATRWPGGGPGGLVSKTRQALARDLPLLAALALPIVLYGIARLQAGLGGTYALDDLPSKVLGIPLSVLNPFRFLFTAFFPVETEDLKRLIAVEDPLTPSFLLTALLVLLLLVLNVLAWAAVAHLLRRADGRAQLRPLLLLALAACALPILVKADPRFMYFGQALLLPLLVLTMTLLGPPLRRRVGRLPVGAAVVTLLVLMGPIHLLAQTALSQPAQVALNREAAMLERAVNAKLSDPGVRRLYLLNSRRDYGLAALQFYAARQGRKDVELRVVDLMLGEETTDAKGAGVSFTRQGDLLLMRVRIGADQSLFGYVTRDDLHRLQAATAVRYGPITELGTTAWGKKYVTQQAFMFSIPKASHLDYVVIGFDPAASGVHVYEPGTTGWRRF